MLLHQASRTLGRPVRLLAIGLLLCAFSPALLATDKPWTGTTNSTWGTNTNWTGNAPAGTDNAVFNSTFTNQPNLAGNASAGGIWMTGSIGQNTTISASSGTLTLQGNTINGTAGLGILVDNANAFALTVSAPIKIGAAQTWTNSSGNLLTVSGAVNINNTGLTVNGSGNTTMSGLISNAGGFTKAGNGTLTLSNTGSTFTGQLTVQAGTLKIDTINNTSANGELGNNALSVILGNTGGVTGTLEYTGGTASSTKKFTMATGGTGAFQIDTAGTILTLSGVIDGTGALTKTGAGTLVLSVANTYSGGTNINAGTLNVGNATAIGSSGTISFNGGTLQYGGITTDFSSRFSTAASQAYNIDTNSQNVTFATALTSSGGTLTKLGSGTLTLTAANTYSGATTISNGTLSLDNAGSSTARLANTSGITVSSGGTLLLASSSGSSNDRINNSATMTLNGGTFNTGGLSEHGASNNTAGLGALTLQATSIIDMGSAASIIAFANSSAASWSGTLKIYNWTGTPQTGGGTDELFFGNGNTGLTAAQLLDIQFYSGSGTGAFGAGALILATGEVVPVPEPSTWIAGAIALSVLAAQFLRRRRSLG